MNPKPDQTAADRQQFDFGLPTAGTSCQKSMTFPNHKSNPVIDGRIRWHLRASWVIATFLGVTAGVAHFSMADRWAKIDATGEPKFEMPIGWMLGESMILGLILALLVGGIGVVVSRICGGKARSHDS